MSNSKNTEKSDSEVVSDSLPTNDVTKDSPYVEDKNDYSYYFYPGRKKETQDKSMWSKFVGGRDTSRALKCISNVHWCAKKDAMVKLLLNALKSHGCDVDLSRHVACEDCRSHVSGGYDPSTNQIVVCQNNSKSRGMCCGVLSHELTHMFDNCRAKLDFTNLEHLACTEIRAAMFHHCSFVSAVTQGDAGITAVKQTHKECVKRKALMSVLMVRDVELEKATKIVDKVFDKCYADLEPFGRIPRRNSRDPQRMLAEGRMYGYYN